MSLPNLYYQYEDYQFMCDILKLEPLPMRDEEQFVEHMQKVLEEHSVDTVNELYEASKLYNIWA